MLVVAVLLAIGAFHLARPVLIPLALAVLLAFVLSPVLGPLERRLGRVPALALLALMMLALLGTLTWGVARQLSELARELPQHRAQLRQRISELRRTTSPPAVGELHGMVDEVVGGLSAGANEPRDGPTPVPVVVQGSGQRDWLSPAALIPLAVAAALTAVLTLFILLERQELRNRIIRLAGYSRLPVATRALDEAARRIATYLITQIAVNAAFGALVSVGLAIMGVPYALVWGLLAALLRFIPVLGFWASLGAALTASLTVSAGWTTPLLVAGLYVGLGVVLMVGVEPHLYSRGAGVSRVALFTAVMALGWLWGAAGLLLATPLTVCLVVLGRHLTELKPIALLLGTAPALPPHVTYYQRQLAGDPDEAEEVVEAFLQAHSFEHVFDGLLLPALHALKRDRLRGTVSDSDQQRVLRATRRIVNDLIADRTDRREADRRATVMGVALGDPIDEVALDLFAAVCANEACRLTMVSSELLSAEVVTAIERDRPIVVCVGAVPPGGLAETRHLLKRLRVRVPGLVVLVGRWGGDGYVEDGAGALQAAGAHAVGTTLMQSREQLVPLLQLRAPDAPALPPGTQAA